MITVRGSIPYPPSADARPILELAADLRQMAAGLGQSSTQLVSMATTASANWVGQAAQAFQNRMASRTATIDEVATTIASAAVPLQTFAAVIQSTSAAYSAAATAEMAARAGLPWTSAALAAALAAEQAALTALQVGGVACATALAVIEGKVAAAQYVLSGMDDEPATRPVPQPAPAPTPTPAPVPTTAVRDAPDWNRLIDGLLTGAQVGGNVGDGALEGTRRGFDEALRRNLQEYVRNGTTFERWRANRGGPLTGMTAAETRAAVNRLGVLGRRLGPVGLVVEGVQQVRDDRNQSGLTTTQRFGRTSAAVLLQGGGAMAGAASGAGVGAAIGSLVGGVGAVPGAVIGGFVGGIAGSLGGSEAGRVLKEWLFQWNPQGAFR